MSRSGSDNDGSGRRVLVDTGPLVALRNKRDQHRARVHKLARQLPGRLFTCWPALTEAVYLLREHPQEISVLLGGFAAGNLSLLKLDDCDVPAIAAIMSKYTDQGFSLADASLMHLAEREEIDEIFTVDQKDFSVFRKTSGDCLTIIA